MTDSRIDFICPEEPAIREMTLGRLPPEEVSRLIQHAERCPACSRLLVRSGALPSSEEVPTNVVEAPAPLSASRPEEVLPRGATVGRYMVLEKLGAGGMGVVYAAYDPELNRRLALKLLHAGSDHVERSGGQARLLREAQALARLSHPNVTSIYDVGTWKERVFIAMELVEGPSLREWLKQGTRPWREVVDVFLAAGRGLAAAHAAGLVHRDFKPDNVLLGRDGRVRVLDFGLARQAAALAAEEPRPLVPDVPWSERSGSSLDTPLTRVGLVIGTPAYMAPESYGGVFDPRADQFSYCVTLYELLYGLRPYGQSPGPPTTWRPPEPPRDARVPASVRRVVLRGLELKPEQRWPSMEALLEALDQTLPRAARPWRVAAGVGVLALGLALPLLWRSAAEPPCRGAGRHLEGLWDGARRQTLGQAFHATGKPNADEAWGRTAGVLDTYARGWETMHVEACEATRVRGEQSDEVLSLRMACLERRLQSLRALTALYARPDAALVDQAAKAAHALPPLSDCANVEVLRAPVPLPDDPTTRDTVEGLRGRLAEARVLFDSGQFKPALERTRALAEEALAVPYRPLQAEVLELRGALEEKSGDMAASEASLQKAVWAAEAGRHDAVIAWASARLVRSGMLTAHFEKGREWAEHSRAVLERMGGDDRVEAFVTNAMGSILIREEKATEALETFRRALALRQKAYPADHPDVAAAFNNLGAAFSKTSREQEAREALTRAQAIYEKALGPLHPETANALHNLGVVAQRATDDAAAVELLTRALGARRAGLGPDSPEVAMTQVVLGASYCALQRYAECLAAHEEAVAIRRKAFGAEHPDVSASLVDVAGALASLKRWDEAMATYQEASRMAEAAKEKSLFHRVFPLTGMAEVHEARGRRAEALALYQRALAIAEKDTGEEVFVLVSVLKRLGSWYHAEGQHRQALAVYQRALALEEKEVPSPRHPDLFQVLLGLGRGHQALGNAAQAIPPLERALALEPSARVTAGMQAEARFLLAQALWAAHRGDGQAKARELARVAQKDFLEARQETEAAQVTSWLRAHAGP